MDLNRMSSKICLECSFTIVIKAEEKGNQGGQKPGAYGHRGP